MTKKVINKVSPVQSLTAPKCLECKHFLTFKSLKQKFFGGFSPLCVAQGYKFTPNCYGSVFCLSLYAPKDETQSSNKEGK
jgi:hypothetical protein